MPGHLLVPDQTFAWQRIDADLYNNTKNRQLYNRQSFRIYSLRPYLRYQPPYGTRRVLRVANNGHYISPHQAAVALDIGANIAASFRYRVRFQPRHLPDRV